ncbi:hypothetical protein M045_gp69 [Mycobacterium phage HINdeR]|uniref:Uncharacterized protein n=1 Tax=Mycobacterium phage HINdeR TaxID=1327770 RepID=R4JEY9_9CAUD|nr:hypothetical protein M045_gp69 [Mycobacterium phage HINdeR]AGK87548.1 hypothetical protein PBI_HINDER_69 [Mycobacterium phage HINdeR]
MSPIPVDMAVITIAVATLLYVVPERSNDGRGIRLTVYRSPVCRTTDPSYAPVQELLGSIPFEHVEHDERPDPDMMFGQAILDVYEVGIDDDSNRGKT